MKLNEMYLLADYRDCLKWKMANQQTEKNTIQHIAESIGVERSYLSRVFNKKANLSDDQLFLIIRKLDFTEDEEFFIKLLFHKERSGLQQRKDILDSEIQEFKLTRLRVDNNLFVTRNKKDKETLLLPYFLDPKLMVVHMFLTLKRYSEQPDLISAQLGFCEGELEKILFKLRDMEIIQFDKKAIKVLKKSVFLEKNDVINESFQDRIRAFSYKKKNDVATNVSNCFSITFTCTNESYMRVRSMIVNLVSQIELITIAENVDQCEDSKVVQMNLDLFPWN